MNTSDLEQVAEIDVDSLAMTPFTHRATLRHSPLEREDSVDFGVDSPEIVDQVEEERRFSEQTQETGTQRRATLQSPEQAAPHALVPVNNTPERRRRFFSRYLRKFFGDPTKHAPRRSRNSWRDAVIAWFGSFVCILCIATIHSNAIILKRDDLYLLIPPFGATAVLIFAMPTSPVAQVRLSKSFPKKNPSITVNARSLPLSC
jgi:hypothetical protein